MYNPVSQLHRSELFALETDHLRLSIINKRDAAKVTDYLVKNRDFHESHSQTHEDSYFTLKTQRDYLGFDVEEFRRGRVMPLWITLKDDYKRIIGKVSFFNFAYGGMMSCTVGYHIDKDFEGQGLMHEALEESVKFLFEECNMHRVEAYIMPENERSLRLIESVGFESEGLKHSYMHINGRWEDHAAYYKLSEK